MNKIKTAFVFTCIILFFQSSGQYKVTLSIEGLPSYHNANESIYIAGSFNNWNPSDKNYEFDKSSGKYIKTLNLPAGSYEYKLTRGVWNKVETAEGGIPTENRKFYVISDTTIKISVLHWADHFPQKPRLSTANRNVHIIDTAFYMPQLNRHRRIWIYLPDGYENSKRKYPVIYMHDGQNVFDAASSFSGEWGVDEALDTLSKSITPTIVVAIDHAGPKRLNEYSPYNMERFGTGEGDKYVDFLVKTLMPFIEKKYRVKKCRRYSTVAGSSMGGLISLYAMLKYPKKFGGAGVFSPAFWIAPSIKNEIEKSGSAIKGKIYFFAGMQENEHMVPDMLAVFQQLSRVSKAKMTSVIRAEGKHSEQTWRNEFPRFYKWIMKTPSR
jgi:alpha-glucosidase